MPQNFVMPNAQSVESLLKMIVGDGLLVTATDVTTPTAPYVATYINDEDKLVALCICDLHFVTFSGAALSMVPASVANEAIVDGQASELMLENFHEIMNICSTILMAESSEHLRLDKTLGPDRSAEPLSTLQKDPCKAATFTVVLPGYGNGSLSFLIG